jgi:hypothetical protein
MRKPKVTVDFIKFSPVNKASHYHTVIDHMTNNPLYPTPDATLIDAQKVVDALDKAILAAADGSHLAISALNDAIATADAVFRILAAYVERIALGDETTILSSGFHFSKQPVFANKETLVAKDGSHSGSVLLDTIRVDRGVTYVWQMYKGKLPDNDSDWVQIGITTQTSFEISNLEIATKYYFRVAAVTPDGIQDFCAPVMKVVQ